MTQTNTARYCLLRQVLLAALLLPLLVACGASGEEDSEADLNPTPAAVAPALSGLASLEFTVNQEISPRRFTNNGGAATNCTVDTADGKPALPTGLTLQSTSAGGVATCEIVGTPTAETNGAVTVTIQAANGELTFAAAVAISVVSNLVVGNRPQLTAPGEQLYTAGSGIIPLNIVNTGGDVQDNGCRATLPAGLNVTTVTDNGKSTCQLNGIPRNPTTAPFSVTITGTNRSGTGSTTFRISVSGSAPATTPPLLTSVTDTQAVQQGSEIPPIDFVNLGGSVQIGGCEVDADSPPLPSGLEIGLFDADGIVTCRITGSPVGHTDGEDVIVTIRAINAISFSTATVTFNIVETVVDTRQPMLQSRLSTQTLFSNTMITPIIFENAGADVTGCTLDPGNVLPAGLMLGMGTDGDGTATCQISGTPTAVTTNPIGVSISGSNANGSSSATVRIIVDDAPNPPDLQAIADVQEFTVGVGISDVSFVNNGGDVSASGCSEVIPPGGSAALPGGLVIRVASHQGKQTCQITGNPTTRTVADATVTVRGVNADGASAATVVIRIRPMTVVGVAPALADLPGVQMLTRGEGARIAFPNTGGDVSVGGCSLDSASAPLPGGLSVDTVSIGGKLSCRITGAPTATTSGDVGIVVRGENTTGHDTATATINVSEPVDPPALADLAATQLTVNVGIDPLVFVNTGGSVDANGCDLAQGSALLPGLVLGVATQGDGKRTCQITGAPTAATAGMVSVGIVGSNDGGSDPAMVGITVINPPDLQAITDVQEFTVGVGISDVSFVNNGGDVSASGCSEVIPPGGSAALPGGLVIRVASHQGKQTCQITGNPTTRTVADATVTVRGVNADGASAATVVIRIRPMTVVGVAPALADLPGVQMLTRGEGARIAFPNTGGDVSVGGCSLDSASAPLPGGLRVDTVSIGGKLSCRITGAPTATTSGDVGIVVRGENTTGHDTATATINVSDPVDPPALADLAATQLTVNVGIDPLVFVNTGGSVDADGCALAQGSALLPGLALGVATQGDGKRTCQITGAPTAATAGMVSVGIVGSNDGGSDPAMVGITVTNPPDLQSVSGVQEFTVGVGISEVSFVNNGGDVSASGCSEVIPPGGSAALPGGLAISVASHQGKQTCQIAGNPTTPTTEDATVTVRGENLGGSSNATVMIKIIAMPVAAMAPVLADVSGVQMLTRGEGARIVFPNTGGDVSVEGCSLDSTSDPLPDGLSVDTFSAGGKVSCRITGAPTAATSGDVSIVVRGENATGHDTATATINVSDPVDPPALADIAATQLTVNVEIDPLVFTNTGGSVDADGCALAQGSALLPGLELGVATQEGGKRTCQITGTPTAATAGMVSVGIVGSNDGGSDSAMVGITVTNPPDLQAITDIQEFTVGVGISEVSFVNNGGDVSASGCSEVIPPGGSAALPGGLAISVASHQGKQTCQIAGNPTTPTTMDATVTVRGENPGGASDATVMIRVVPMPMAPVLDNISGIQMFTTGDTNVQIVFNNTGGDVSVGGCSLDATSDLLPTGLAVDTVSSGGKISCQISGSTTGATDGNVTIVVRAANNVGSGTALAIINVSDPVDPPALADIAATRLTVNEEIDPLVFTNTGGSVDADGCALAQGSALLPGLELEVATQEGGKRTCQITGTPTMGTAGMVSVGIVGTNDGGSDSAMVGITVTNPPDLQSVPGLQEFTVGVGISEVSFVNNGGDVSASGCSEVIPPGGSAALPGGLAISVASHQGKQTCQIAGNPTTPTTMDATVTVRGENPGGASDATVLIRVVPMPMPPALADISGVQMFTTGDTNVQIVFPNAGGDVAARSCSLDATSDPLPTGLEVDTVSSGGKISCQISGSTTVATDGDARVVVRGMNNIGSDTAVVVINVSDPVVIVDPPILANLPLRSQEINTRIDPPLIFPNTGESVNADGCNLAPGSRLPTGLSLTPVQQNDGKRTCQITGRPTEITPNEAPITISIEASNDNPTPATATVMIALTLPPPPPVTRPELVDLQATVPLTQGLIIQPIELVNTGAAVASKGCGIAAGSGLPQGLELSVTSADPAGCQITGIPFEVISGQQEIVVIGRNDQGQDQSTVTITITANSSAAVPVLQDPQPRVLDLGNNIPPIVIANSGGSAANCSIARGAGFPGTLGVELVPNNGVLSCQVVGRVSDVIVGEVSATITASNPGGMDTASITISAGNPDPPQLVDIANRRSLAAGREIDPITFGNTGGSVAEGRGCRVVTDEQGFDSLPASLAISTVQSRSGVETCQITGTPAASTNGVLILKVEGFNIGRRDAVNGGIETFEQTDSATVSIEVSPIPNLANISGARTLTRLLPFGRMVFTNTGSSIRAGGCSLSTPSQLPQGLSLVDVVVGNGPLRTCAITGLPLAVSPQATYNIVGTDANGQTDSATVSFEVVDLPASPSCGSLLMTDDLTGNYPITDNGPRLFLLGNHTNNTIQNEFLFRYKGSNTYQAIGVFDVNGAIANYDAASTSFIIRSNPAGTIFVIGPSNQADSYELFGSANLLRTDDGTGLMADSVALSTGGTFIFTLSTGSVATPANGANAASLTIEDCTAPRLVATASANLVYNEMSVSIPIASESGGGLIEGCALSQSSAALPGTLTANVNTERSRCVVSGNAGTSPGTTMHSIVASNGAGDDTAALTISIAARPSQPVPVLLAPTIDSTTTFNVDIALAQPILVENTAQNATIAANSCQFVSSSGGVPSASTPVRTMFGLSIATDTTNDRCAITGTPDTGGTIELFVVTTNGDGEASNVVAVSLLVSSPAPILEAPEAGLIDLTDASSTITISNKAGAAAIASCFLRDQSSFISVAKNGDGSACIATIDTSGLSADKGLLVFHVAARNAANDASDFVRVDAYYSFGTARPDLQPLPHYSGVLTMTRGVEVDMELVNVGGHINADGCIDHWPCGMPELLDLGLRIESVMGENGRRTCRIRGTPTRAVSQFPMMIVGESPSGPSGGVFLLEILPGVASAPRLRTFPNVVVMDQGFSTSPILFPNLGDNVSASNGCQGVSGLPSGLRVERRAAPNQSRVVGNLGRLYISRYAFYKTDEGTGGADTCVVTGKPSEPTSGVTQMTIAASNAAGTHMVRQPIVVRPIPTPSAAPALTPIPEFTFSQGRPGQSVTFVNTGGNVTPLPDPIGGCAVDTSGGKPGLPDGLRTFFVVDGSGKWTCRIAGTAATLIQGTVTVTIAASNAAGSTTTTIGINVDRNPPALGVIPNFPGSVHVSYGNYEHYVWANWPSPGIFMVNWGEPAVSCSSQPVLPTGLSLSNTCKIGGSATTETPLRTYTITGRAANGLTSSLGLKLGVRAHREASQAPGVVDAGIVEIHQDQRRVPHANLNTHFDFENTGGGAVYGCRLDTSDGKPALPPGLSIGRGFTRRSGYTCSIIGAVRSNHPDVTVTVIARNRHGTNSATATIRVIPGLPPQLYLPHYDTWSFTPDPDGGPGTVSVPAGETSLFKSVFIDLDIQNRGVPVTRCESDPALPTGVLLYATPLPKVRPTGCLVSGYPIPITPKQRYTITGYTAKGTADTYSFDMEITRANSPLCDLRNVSHWVYRTVPGHDNIYDIPIARLLLERSNGVPVSPDRYCNLYQFDGDCTRGFGVTRIYCDTPPRLTTNMVSNIADWVRPASYYGPHFLKDRIFVDELSIKGIEFSGSDLPLVGGSSESPISGLLPPPLASSPPYSPLQAQLPLPPGQFSPVQPQDESLPDAGAFATGASDGERTALPVYRAEGQKFDRTVTLEEGMRMQPLWHAMWEPESLRGLSGKEFASQLPLQHYIEGFGSSRKCHLNREPPDIEDIEQDYVGFQQGRWLTNYGPQVDFNLAYADGPNFANSGAPVVGCSVSPSLPSGVHLLLSKYHLGNGAFGGPSCLIRGVAVEPTPEKTYTVTARSEGGWEDSATVDIRVDRLSSWDCRLIDRGVTHRAVEGFENVYDIPYYSTTPDPVGDFCYSWLPSQSGPGCRRWVAHVKRIHCSDISPPDSPRDEGDVSEWPNEVYLGDPSIVGLEFPDVTEPLVAPPLIWGPVRPEIIIDPLEEQSLFGEAVIQALEPVSAGSRHSCVVQPSGSLACWGANDQGQVLEDSEDSRLAPRGIGDNNWLFADSGSTQTCAINIAGELKCWGKAASVGSFPVSSVDTDSRGREIHRGWSSVSAGKNHVCGIGSSGEMHCWGENDSGQLGFGDTVDRPRPAFTGWSGWQQVSVGASHSCAINRDSQLWCWGNGGSGQTGLGRLDSQPLPAQVGANGPLAEGWQQVSAGESHTCAVRKSGALYCWGSYANGRLGLAGTVYADQLEPVLVGIGSEMIRGWWQVSAGKSHTCAVRESGALFCWGDNSQLQLGRDILGDATHSGIPIPVDAGKDWLGVGAGDSHSCAVKHSGAVHCWGLNSSGQLGFDTDEDTSLPGVALEAPDYTEEEADASSAGTPPTTAQP